MQKNRRAIDRVGNSLAGLRESWRQDGAIRRQVIFSFVASILLIAARPPIAWVLASLVLLVAGFAIELVNGAIEALLDRLHPQTDKEIGAAKDMTSAAAFIINAAAAITLGGALLSSIARSDS
jgi:diacylglycerol kinase